MGGKITKKMQKNLRNEKIFYIFAAHSVNHKHLRSQKSLEFLGEGC
jgi:hypothetical protein